MGACFSSVSIWIHSDDVPFAGVSLIEIVALSDELPLSERIPEA
ncbi:hypothetical protein L798_15061 [Zootermopsis nevadensis]|uniref:Uncharacterized protein n=1 Tax=Zootermopsis nevadensis TaxID=136037 RepID=A0A067R0K2_ZOONE|nr:hypothetical protein L798_15061 [Zootermopsis nevadensis]